MAEIECPIFTEDVACEMDGKYKIAHGWTMSTGSGGNFPYTPPAGWEYDPRYTDIFGLIGSHGGCADCFMALVHLISIDPVINDPEQEWYSVFVDNAGYFLLFVAAGIAINEIAK